MIAALVKNPYCFSQNQVVCQKHLFNIVFQISRIKQDGIAKDYHYSTLSLELLHLQQRIASVLLIWNNT